MAAHKHNHHFVESPFLAVKQYEKAFDKAGKEYITQAITDVLEYIAEVTVSVIKTNENIVTEE